MKSLLRPIAMVPGILLALLSGATNAAIISYNAADEFITGPAAQTATNQWQYFQGNSTRSAMNLLTDWDTGGNEIYDATPEWDQNGGPGGNNHYPFVQKTGAAGGNFGADISGNALIIHPGWQGDGADTVVSVGWYNNTGYTVSLGFDATFTLEEGHNSNGIEYFVQRSLSGDGRFLSLADSLLVGGPGLEDNFVNVASTGIELLAGEMLFVGIDNNGSYEWDHTRLDLDITVEFDDSPVPVPLPGSLLLLVPGLLGLRQIHKQRQPSLN